MTTPSLDLNGMLEVRMSYDAERQKVLAQNIANIDTPGYRALDLKPLNFGNVLSSAVSRVQLAVTNSMHLNGSRPFSDNFQTQPSRNTYERTPTGGTVVLEEQMTKIAQNATDYQMTTSLYKKVGNLFKEALGLQPS